MDPFRRAIGPNFGPSFLTEPGSHHLIVEEPEVLKSLVRTEEACPGVREREKPRSNSSCRETLFQSATLRLPKSSPHAGINFQRSSVGNDQRRPTRFQQLLISEFAKNAGDCLAGGTDTLTDLSVSQRAE